LAFGNQLKNTPHWHEQNTQYENWWIDYFKTIFLPHRNPNAISKVIIWESCPGGTPFPHPNYAFFNLHVPLHFNRDRFLINAAKCIKIKWKDEHANPLTKLQLLTELAKHNYFIMDILPTHGMVMTKVRPKLLKADHDHAAIKALRQIFKERNQWLEKQLNGNYEVIIHHDLPICQFLKPIYCKILQIESLSIHCNCPQCNSEQ